ncbi:MAG: RHS repeat protein [Proteobacteria bacterium]|nr:RHS repeat protein [Pseudomonadota bacterium]
MSFTDQEGHAWEYRCDDNHNLMSVIDPRGIEVLTTEYDEDGRLIGTSDALGNSTEITHDKENVREYIRDRNGNLTIYEYNENGYVINEIRLDESEVEYIQKQQKGSELPI